MKPHVSIIIPVYNEVLRLDKLAEVHAFLKKQSFASEVIVVDDGSRNQTKDALEKLKKKYSFQLVSYSPNRGKGYAIKQGMLAAEGEYRLFTDLDLSTPLEEFQKFIPLLDTYPVIIGTRKVKGANVLVHQNLLRENMGKVFTLLSQTFLGLWLSDFTCGFKCFSKEAAEKIFSQLTINRWGFDSEALFLAHKYKFAIKEVPVVWKNEANTKVRFPRDIIVSFYELVKIRLNDMRGAYGH